MEWSGTLGFVVAVITSILVCRWILCYAPVRSDTSGDEAYDKLVMFSIRPRSGGISIDIVAEALKGQDLGDFSLARDKQ